MQLFKALLHFNSRKLSVARSLWSPWHGGGRWFESTRVYHLLWIRSNFFEKR